MSAAPFDPVAAEAAVQAAYDAHRRGRPGKLETADMTVLGTTAVRHGVRLTVELIRRITGGGSPNTIHPLIEHFTQVELPRLLSERAAAVPEPLTTLWQQLEAAATEAGAAMLSEPRQALAEGQAALARDRAALEADRLAVDAARAAADRVAAELRTAFEVLQARNTEVEKDLTAAQHVIEGQAHELGGYQARLKEQSGQLASVQLALTEAITERDTARQALAQITAAHADATAHADAAHSAQALAEAALEGALDAQRRAEDRAGDLRDQVIRERDRIDRLHREMRDLESALVEERGRASAATHERDAARKEAGEHRVAVARLERDVSEGAQALAAARATMASTAAERDRLQHSLALALAARPDIPRKET